MDLLEAQAARGKTVVATTHDLACAAERFQQVLAVNRTVVAYGPSNLVLDADVLARGLRRAPARHRGTAPSSSTTPTTTTTPRPASATSTTWAAADGVAARAAVLADLRAGAARVRARGRGVRRGRARTWCCAGSRSSATRSRTPRFPGVVVAYMVGVPFYLGRGDRRRRNGARDRLRDQAVRAPPGHVDRRPVRGHVRPRRLPVQHDRRLRRRPVQLPARATCWRSAPGTSSRWWSWAPA